MTRRTFRGRPLLSTDGWVVVRRYRTDWEPLIYTVGSTRSEAIRKYDAMWEGIPDAYRKARRRGEVLAVHCWVEPLAFEAS